MTKIPKDAKRVFTGVIFDVYQWSQKLFNHQTATFEAIKRQDTVVIIPIVGKKIAFQKQKQPNTDWFIDVPAGRMDVEGETPKQTALRELKEETGLAPKKIKLWKKFPKHGKIVHNIYLFIAYDCRVVSEQNLDGGEKIIVKYVTFEQFLKLSDDPHFYGGELMTIMLRARLNKKLKAEFKKLLFPD